MLQTYTENCHCGALKLEVDLDLTQMQLPLHLLRPPANAVLVGGGQGRWVSDAGGRRSVAAVHVRPASASPRLLQAPWSACVRRRQRAPIGKMYAANLGCVDQLADRELYELKISYGYGLHYSFEAPRHSRHL